MVTLKADNKRRVAIPDIKPGQVFAFEDNGDGSYTLIKVKAERKEPFPPGSLRKYFDRKRDAEMSAIAKAMPLPPLPEDY
ncbi:MAG TPA: hypothetical protein VFB72_10895 [Verrucomicrobiae bacterium]|nr:hypothetical protein [Verrucomicrobiae bacterium]